MDRFTIDQLNLNPKSEHELHSALTNFELKWQRKANHAINQERISRF